MVDYWTRLQSTLVEALQKVTIEIPEEVTAVLDSIAKFRDSLGEDHAAYDVLNSISKETTLQSVLEAIEGLSEISGFTTHKLLSDGIHNENPTYDVESLLDKKCENIFIMASKDIKLILDGDNDNYIKIFADAEQNISRKCSSVLLDLGGQVGVNVYMLAFA